MQGPIYGPETTNQELNAQAYPVLMQKPRKSQKTKQQKSNALSQFPLAEDPPSFAQQRPQVQSPAIAPRQQQVNVQKQAVSEPPIKMEPGTAPKQPPQSKQQPEPDQHQPQPKEKDTSRIDMQSMIDVTSYTSINLKQEEENIINAIIPNYDNLGITFSTTDADRTEVDSFLDFDALGLRLDAIARVNGLKFTDRRLMSFVSVAVRNLIRDLLERMSIASKHRSGITHKKLIASDRSQKDSNCEYSLDFNIIVTDDTKEALSKIKEGEMQIDKKLREKLGLPIIPEEVEQETPEEEQKPQDAEQKDGESKDPPPADAAATPEDQTPTQTPGSSTLPTSAIPSADSVAPAPAPSKRKKKASKIRDLPDVIKVRNTNEVIMAALGGVPLKSWMATASSSTFNFLSKPNQKDQAAGGKLDNKSRIITVVPLKRKADAHDGEESLKPENSDKKEEKTHESKDETANDGKSQEIKEEPADASLPRIPADSKYWSKIGIASDKTCIPGMVTADHTTNKDFEADDKGHKITLRDALFCLQMQRNFCKSPVLHKWLMR